jgi:hypothetical protein
MSREEGDVSLCREYHMSLEQVRDLNPYEKRLLMGWIPFNREAAERAAQEHVDRMKALVGRHGVRNGR